VLAQPHVAECVGEHLAHRGRGVRR
jgi:hypothetical protein